jgi:hypothetical protein
MAPVAGSIANGEENGLFFLPGLSKGLLCPGIPVHRIFGVLEKIRAFLVNQMVGHGPDGPILRPGKGGRKGGPTGLRNTVIILRTVI